MNVPLCPTCGYHIAPDWNSCPRCGTPLTPLANPQATNPQQNANVYPNQPGQYAQNASPAGANWQMNQNAAYQAPPAQPPAQNKRGGAGKWILIGAAVLIGLILLMAIAGSGDDSSSPASQPSSTAEAAAQSGKADEASSNSDKQSSHKKYKPGVSAKGITTFQFGSIGEDTYILEMNGRSGTLSVDSDDSGKEFKLAFVSYDPASKKLVLKAYKPDGSLFGEFRGEYSQDPEMPAFAETYNGVFTDCDGMDADFSLHHSYDAFTDEPIGNN